MRISVKLDGKHWVVRLDEVATKGAPKKRIGWEAVIFETDPPEIQRVVYRPAGWLNLATPNDLTAALGEAEAVRTRWEPAGS